MPSAGMLPPQSNMASPQAQPGGQQGPIHGHQEPTNYFSRRLKSSGLGTANHSSRTTLAHSSHSAPMMLKQWGGILSGTRRWQGKRAGGLGTGIATGSTTTLDSSLTQTLFIRALNARKEPYSLAPTAGGAPCPWQCPLPAALGMQR